MDAKALAGRGPAELDIARQDDASGSECRDKTEAVVRRQDTVTLLEGEGLRDLSGSQIMSDHALSIERPPFLVREVEELRCPYG